MTVTTVSQRDLEHLAERLLSRSRSRLSDDPPSLQSDLLLAGKILTRLCRGGADLGLPLTLDDD